MKKWAEMANDYFNAGLDEESAKRWEREIGLNVANVRDNDVCNAIRENRGTKLRRKLTVADIIGWLSETMPSSDKMLKSCNFCNRGWIELSPDLGNDDFTLDEYDVSYRSTLPCTCSSGAHHMSTKYDSDQGQALQGMRMKARSQRQHYNQLVKEIDVEDARAKLDLSGVIKKAV